LDALISAIAGFEPPEASKTALSPDEVAIPRQRSPIVAPPPAAM
jgi:hypothetical protein